jgi:membrane-associated phospholipid phosphatase
MMGWLLLVFVQRSPDVTVYQWIHDDWRSPTATTVFETLTHSGDAGTWALGLLNYAIFGDTMAYRHTKTVLLGSMVLANGVILLKGLTNRQRPTGTHSRWESSFPSGHTALAFYTAMYFSEAYPRAWIRAGLFLWATGVGLSRIYLGRHWPSDVLVGAVLGMIGGHLVYRHRQWFLSVHLYP